MSHVVLRLYVIGSMDWATNIGVTRQHKNNKQKLAAPEYVLGRFHTPLLCAAQL